MKIIITILALFFVAFTGYLFTRESAPDSSQEKDGYPVVSSAKTLDLHGQGLTKAPMYIFERTGLEELDLSGNDLSGSLQAEVRHLQDLKVLDLSNNKFTGVPAEIGQLKNLRVLNLSNNLLTGLPNELGNLSNLTLLDISGNNYSKADLALIKEKLPPTTVIKTE